MSSRSERSISSQASGQGDARSPNEIVDVRYGSRSIVLTSNLAMNDWMGIFPDHVTAGAILDRLSHHAHQIQLKGESIWKKLGRASLKQPVENKEKPE